ncbi:bifunctional phosphopantothenoylcysteine decarboxylase/phosphopantothenate--cysteine ligase CoaBC [Granulosicoccus antarcticus]|uniref:Coenzyme A biosynthesis bifunctional protein CoaBC n=1 Tax=Granulosicoccus antarcticus IMCC3135 TaxID=1192854 RepID=A0A2Z2P225_9GAMM|nr:bifunctional phosphopantothenoylcysteine decarboxylase/phosphopantothenate--cysteine ligase CoaBC [Granulosicoccus antarcticus]ASJ76631.1 Coenzyme A biosynthesis bifunctional protein CoaBC [Granulosicoccus antarcticus IMCC3135]
MSTLTNKKILLGVSGGIAAYKSAILARRLIDEGATVRVVMTQGAQAFMQPLTFQALTGNPVHLDLLDPAAEAAMGHIELARWADAILIAPASANTLARLAHGMASDLLSTLCLATDAPIHVAPAMNRLMWSNPATIDNCAILSKRGVSFFGPGSGAQACGEVGSGRMLEPEEIRDQMIAAMNNEPSPTANNGPLAGKQLLITAGPTREAIDPVRYISNHSSGKMGFALAEAARLAGAMVTLVAGPVALQAHSDIKRIDVVSAEQMLKAVMSQVDKADVFISVAAVSDYRLTEVMDQKIKKNSTEMTLTLVRNPDILKSVADLPNRPFVVGFAAETENVEVHARGKLEKKALDMIAANHVGQADNPVFSSDTNALDVYWPADNGHEHIPSATKQSVAHSLLDIIGQQMSARKTT